MWGWLGLPAMGVAGIALATVVIQVAGGAWLARHVVSTELCRALPRSYFRPDAAALRRILAQSVPAMLNMLTVALGIFVITWFVKHFGKQAVAASGIATRIEQVVLMPAIGLNTAVLSLVGQNHGAGLAHRVLQFGVTSDEGVVPRVGRRRLLSCAAEVLRPKVKGVARPIAMEDKHRGE